MTSVIAVNAPNLGQNGEQGILIVKACFFPPALLYLQYLSWLPSLCRLFLGRGGRDGPGENLSIASSASAD